MVCCDTSPQNANAAVRSDKQLGFFTTAATDDDLLASFFIRGAVDAFGWGSRGRGGRRARAPRP